MHVCALIFLIFHYYCSCFHFCHEDRIIRSTVLPSSFIEYPYNVHFKPSALINFRALLNTNNDISVATTWSISRGYFLVYFNATQVSRIHTHHHKTYILGSTQLPFWINLLYIYSALLKDNLSISGYSCTVSYMSQSSPYCNFLTKNVDAL